MLSFEELDIPRYVFAVALIRLFRSYWLCLVPFSFSNAGTIFQQNLAQNSGGGDFVLVESHIYKLACISTQNNYLTFQLRMLHRKICKIAGLQPAH